MSNNYLNGDLYIKASDMHETGVTVTSTKPRLGTICKNLADFVEGLAAGDTVHIHIDLNEALYELATMDHAEQDEFIATAAANARDAVDYFLSNMEQPFYLVRLQKRDDNSPWVARVIQADSDNEARDIALRNHPDYRLACTVQWLDADQAMAMRKLGLA